MLGNSALVQYLDDFLLMSSPARGLEQLNSLLNVFMDLGLPLAMENLEGLSPCVTFLGIELDSVALKVQFPQKISKLRRLIRKWLGRRSCLKKELQSLVGKLQHACKVVTR